MDDNRNFMTKSTMIGLVMANVKSISVRITPLYKENLFAA